MIQRELWPLIATDYTTHEFLNFCEVLCKLVISATLFCIKDDKEEWKWHTKSSRKQMQSTIQASIFLVVTQCKKPSPSDLENILVVLLRKICAVCQHRGQLTTISNWMPRSLKCETWFDVNPGLCFEVIFLLRDKKFRPVKVLYVYELLRSARSKLE